MRKYKNKICSYYASRNDSMDKDNNNITQNNRKGGIVKIKPDQSRSTTHIKTNDKCLLDNGHFDSKFIGQYSSLEIQSTNIMGNKKKETIKNHTRILNKKSKTSGHSRADLGTNIDNKYHCSNEATYKTTRNDNVTTGWSYNTPCNITPYKRSDAYKALLDAANSTKYYNECDIKEKKSDKNVLNCKLPLLNLNINSLVYRNSKPVKEEDYKVQSINKLNYGSRSAMDIESPRIPNNKSRDASLATDDILKSQNRKKLEDNEHTEEDIETNIVDIIRECILDIAQDQEKNSDLKNKRNNQFVHILAKKINNKLKKHRLVIRAEERELARQEYIEYIENQLEQIHNSSELNTSPSNIAKSNKNVRIGSSNNENCSTNKIYFGCCKLKNEVLSSKVINDKILNDKNTRNKINNVSIKIEERVRNFTEFSNYCDLDSVCPIDYTLSSDRDKLQHEVTQVIHACMSLK